MSTDSTDKRRSPLKTSIKVATVVTTLLALSLGAIIYYHHVSWATPRPPFLGWPVAGDAAHDHKLASRAQTAWDTARGHHSPVYPILLQTDSPTGPIVIMQGTDAHGANRLALLTASRNSSSPQLVLRSDRPLPTTDPQQISIVTDRLGDTPGSLPNQRGDTLAIAVARPGTTKTIITSSVTPPTRPTTAIGRVAYATLPWAATAFTTEITVASDNDTYTTPADDDAIGTRHAVPLSDMATKGTTLTATTSGARLGSLVTARAGVVGVVTATDGNSITAALLTDANLQLRVTSPHTTSAILGTVEEKLGIVAAAGHTQPDIGELFLANDADGITQLPVAKVITTTPETVLAPLTTTTDQLWIIAVSD